MNAIRRFILCSCFLVAVGCGRMGHVPVEGIVTLDGKPLKDAAVTFIPTAGGRPGLASSDTKGRFSMKDAGMKPGLLPGRYKVIVFKVLWTAPSRVIRIPAGPTADGKAPPMIEMPEGQPRIEKYIVPERYCSERTSGLSASITGPTKELAFNLTTIP
ncbi:MAG: carboxypeptidase-like regulatory domain-containing protein [Planctomycetota bacterium]